MLLSIIQNRKFTWNVAAYKPFLLPTGSILWFNLFEYSCWWVLVFFIVATDVAGSDITPFLL